MKSLFTFSILLLVCVKVLGQPNDAGFKTQLIDEILAVNGSSQQALAMGAQTSSILADQAKRSTQGQIRFLLEKNSIRLTPDQAKRIYPSVQTSVHTAIDLMKPDLMSAMLGVVRTMYQNEFTLEEIKQLHQFTTGEVGKKHSSVTGGLFIKLLAAQGMQQKNFENEVSAKIFEDLSNLLTAEGIRLTQK